MTRPTRLLAYSPPTGTVRLTPKNRRGRSASHLNFIVGNSADLSRVISKIVQYTCISRLQSLYELYGNLRRIQRERIKELKMIPKIIAALTKLTRSPSWFQWIQPQPNKVLAKELGFNTDPPKTLPLNIKEQMARLKTIGKGFSLFIARCNKAEITLKTVSGLKWWIQNELNTLQKYSAEIQRQSKNHQKNLRPIKTAIRDNFTAKEQITCMRDLIQKRDSKLIRFFDHGGKRWVALIRKEQKIEQCLEAMETTFQKPWEEFYRLKAGAYRKALKHLDPKEDLLLARLQKTNNEVVFFRWISGRDQTFLSQVSNSKKMGTLPNFAKSLQEIRKKKFSGYEEFVRGLRHLAAYHYTQLQSSSVIKQDHLFLRFVKIKMKVKWQITREILSTSDPDERRNLITALVLVVKKLCDVGELNFAMAIYLALNPFVPDKKIPLDIPTQWLAIEQKAEKKGHLIVPFVELHSNRANRVLEKSAHDLKVCIEYFLRNQSAWRAWLDLYTQNNVTCVTHIFTQAKPITVFEEMRGGMFKTEKKLATELQHLLIGKYVEISLTGTSALQPVLNLIARIKDRLHRQFAENAKTAREKANFIIAYFSIARQLGRLGEPNLAHAMSVIANTLLIKNRDTAQHVNHSQEALANRMWLIAFNKSVRHPKPPTNTTPLFSINRTLNFLRKSQTKWKNWHRQQLQPQPSFFPNITRRKRRRSSSRSPSKLRTHRRSRTGV